MPTREHLCTIDEDSEKLSWAIRIRLISPTNPLRLGYFRSNVAIKEEQLRQLKVNRRAIHPFSEFRAWYEIYLVFLYGSVLITKPMDAAYLREDVVTINFYMVYTILTDILCWVDMIITCFTGYDLNKNRNIELRQSRIVRHYLFGKYLLFDVVSSFPKAILYFVPTIEHDSYVYGIFTLMSLFKIVRVVSFIIYLGRSAEYFKILSKKSLFLVCSVIAAFTIIHWMACLQFAIPKLVRKYFTVQVQRTSWYIVAGLENKSFLTQYSHSFFKSSAYILGIRMILYNLDMTEEYVLAVVTYFIGKILIAFIWIILAAAILNARFMDIKFAEVINQLEEYMKQKQLPLSLRNRIYQYFIFKYQNKYFKEDVISNLLSENLKREANLHVCKSLIKNVSLFCELTPLEISKVVEYLIPEIFLPNDTIIHSGTHGDAMYFLSSGTVAVYTRSGKEICHLQDGAYFGEIDLVLKGQYRLITIVAIETSHVYRLNKKDLERCLLTNKAVRRKIMVNAEMRLKEATRMEEAYKELLFEKSYGFSEKRQ